MIDAAAPESKLTMSVQEMAYQALDGTRLMSWLNNVTSQP